YRSILRKILLLHARRRNRRLTRKPLPQRCRQRCHLRNLKVSFLIQRAINLVAPVCRLSHLFQPLPQLFPRFSQQFHLFVPILLTYNFSSSQSILLQTFFSAFSVLCANPGIFSPLATRHCYNSPEALMPNNPVAEQLSISDWVKNLSSIPAKD